MSDFRLETGETREVQHQARVPTARPSQALSRTNDSSLWLMARLVPIRILTSKNKSGHSLGSVAMGSGVFSLWAHSPAPGGGPFHLPNVEHHL